MPTLQHLGNGAQLDRQISFQPLRLGTLRTIQLFYSRRTAFGKLPLTTREQQSKTRPHRSLYSDAIIVITSN